MSKNVSSQIDKKYSKDVKKQYVNSVTNNNVTNNNIVTNDALLEAESSMSLRKRAERQASQGVKALVDREKGNSSERMLIDPKIVVSSIPGINNAPEISHVYTGVSSNPKQEAVQRGYTAGNAGQNLAYSTSNSSNMPHMQTNQNNPIYLAPQYSSQSNPHINANYANKIQSNPHIIMPPSNPYVFSTSHTGQNIPQYIMNNSQPQNMSNISASSSRQIFSRPHREDRERILNRVNIEKILIEKVKREGLEIKFGGEIISVINNGVEIYLKNMIEKLIAISRARNVNLNLFSKTSEKNPMFKIHSFNLERVLNPNNQIELSPSPYKDFSIVFTKNTKHTINMLEEYEELSLKKTRQEKMMLYKNKLEEITTQKEKEKLGVEKPEKIPQSLVVRPRGRKKESSMLKSVRNTLAKSQKKIEMDKQKKDTQNTLEKFLDNKPKFRETSSQLRFDTEIASNIGESHNFETYTKLSEISKSEAPGTVNINAESGSNEINLCIFKNAIPSQNMKIPNSISVRRRITLKDLIFYLERERNIPFYNLVLYRAMIKLAQFSSN